MDIVKLPPYAFYPQASVNASILFYRKPQPYDPKKEGIFFCNVESDSRSNDTCRRAVPQNDFDELKRIWIRQETLWQEWRIGERTQNVHGMDMPVQWNHPHFWFSSLKDINHSDYNLLSEQYQPVQLLQKSMQEPREILKEMQKLGHEIMEVTEQLDSVYMS